MVCWLLGVGQWWVSWHGSGLAALQSLFAQWLVPCSGGLCAGRVVLWALILWLRSAGVGHCSLRRHHGGRGLLPGILDLDGP
eukprot:12452079-Alexandrium_andersonii.AAC.1